MPSDLLSLACALYHTSPGLLVPLSGGHYNAVYQFPLAGEPVRYGILRIGVEDCPRDQTLGMLEFMRYLNQENGPVVAPLPSRHDLLLESLEFEQQRYTITAFEKADGILAENIPSSQWNDDLFRSIGRAVGRLHCLSAGFQPARISFDRPFWHDSFELREASRLLAAAGDPAGEKLSTIIRHLHHLPAGADEFGLIHGDLHFANFLIQEQGEVKVIDFDDCQYGWYSMDVAMALFDVLVLYKPPGEAEKERFARQFLTNYLSGYRSQWKLLPACLEQIPTFLKLKELCIYATLVGHPDIDLPDTWVGRFMHDRARRIADDLPYVRLDFSTF